MENLKCKPVFLKQKNIPDSDNKPSVLEICREAERVSGQGSILGAQMIRELWRIYPATKEAREELLIRRITIRGVSLSLNSSNPYIIREDTGEEKLTTKVWIDDLPMSVADEDLEQALVKTGCELRSKILADRARDANNKLTRFLTGKRFVFITVPETPLPRSLKVNIFNVRLYHKEQKSAERKTVCSNCLETDHHRSVCTKAVVCRACKLPGHKQGDEACALPRTEEPPVRPRERSPTHAPDSQDPQLEGETDFSNRPQARKEKNANKEKNKKESNSRSRPFVRQTTISSTLELDRHQPRSRSETPKRRRSRELHAPTGNQEKQARRDNTGRRDLTDDDSDTETPASIWN